MPAPSSASMASAVLAPVTTASFDVRPSRSTTAGTPGNVRSPVTATIARFSSTACAISAVHVDRQAVVAHDHRVDLVPRVTDDEAALVVGQLLAVAAHGEHDRFDVLALAVDQRAVEVEQECVGRGRDND